MVTMPNDDTLDDLAYVAEAEFARIEAEEEEEREEHEVIPRSTRHFTGRTATSSIVDTSRIESKHGNSDKVERILTLRTRTWLRWVCSARGTY